MRHASAIVRLIQINRSKVPAAYSATAGLPIQSCRIVCPPTNKTKKLFQL
jgi:hypothetical protein